MFVPALEEFKPGAVIVSAGQDALFDDPESSMLLFPADFGTLTALLRDATDQPLVLVPEGGYEPSPGEAISQIFLRSIDRLLHQEVVSHTAPLAILWLYLRRWGGDFWFMVITP